MFEKSHILNFGVFHKAATLHIFTTEREEEGVDLRKKKECTEMLASAPVLLE